MAYFVYVIKSLCTETRYTGSTENVARRLGEHNAGKCPYTKKRRPWIVIHQEEFSTRIEARQREKYLKTGQGREHLNKLFRS